MGQNLGVKGHRLFSRLPQGLRPCFRDRGRLRLAKPPSAEWQSPLSRGRDKPHLLQNRHLLPVPPPTPSLMLLACTSVKCVPLRQRSTPAALPPKAAHQLLTFAGVPLPTPSCLLFGRRVVHKSNSWPGGRESDEEIAEDGGGRSDKKDGCWLEVGANGPSVFCN